jgi:hypothetical protein
LELIEVTYLKWWLMMSTSQSKATTTLFVTAPEQTTEIFVVNSNFKRVASGLGRLETEVEPGIYKVRFRSGGKQRDELVEVKPGQPSANVTTDPLGFSSAAPIANTRTTREAHRSSAEAESTNVHLKKGSGSQLYLYVRDLEPDDIEPPWAGMSLHDIEGKLLAEMTAGVCDQQHGFSALNIELNPGTYRLRIESGPLGVFEMFLITADGWQTQAFLLAADFQVGEVTARRAALKTAAVFMTRMGHGFHSDNERFRHAELARKGLVMGRSVFNRETLNELLWGKFENPMMGIFGAHLLIQARRPNHELIDEVVTNLSNLLGSHADVDALMLRSRTLRRLNKLEFPTPPMLRSSWELIVRNSLRQLGTVPGGSVTSALADGLLSSAPWLLHRLPDIQQRSRPAEGINFAQSQRVLENLVAFGGGEGREMLLQASRDRKSFSPLELKIMNASLDAARVNDFTADFRGESDKAKVITPSQIIRNLEAPSISIAQSTLSLADKLGVKTSS